MSGHSKWHNIQARKGKQDKAKSGQFTKVARLISVAAKEGGADPDTNFSLRLAIDKARAVNMPKDNIERAIKRGTGELKDAEVLESILYEGFGPGGVALLVDVLTDNRNRSASDIKYAITKHGGTMGGPGSVQWQFEKKGVIRLSAEKRVSIPDWDMLQLSLMDAGALDIQEEEAGITIVCAMEELRQVLGVLSAASLEADDSGIEWLPKETVTVQQEQEVQLETILDALHDLDDVRDVYTNVS